MSTSLVAVVLLRALLLTPWYQPTNFETPTDFYSISRVIAHKAHTTHTGPPGNTLEALDTALQLGISAVELDISQTSDGTVVLFHDENLDNLTNGQGPIASRTWGELQRVHYRASTQSRIPSLDEVFARYGRHFTYFLDVKEWGIADSGLLSRVHKIVTAHGLSRYTVLDSLNPALLFRARWLYPDWKISLGLVEDAQPTAEESPEQLARIPWILRLRPIQRLLLRVLHPDIAAPRFSNSADWTRTLHQHGWPLIAWSVDSVTLSRELGELGVFAFETNEPLALLGDGTNRSIPDALGAFRVSPERIFKPTSLGELQAALRYAQERSLPVAFAGRRHSMGGQTMSSGIVVDTLNLDEINYNEDAQEVTVQAGVSWKQLQTYLNEHGRSVVIMQSDNAFTVGGSLSTNVHGWAMNQPPIAASVVSLRMILADGRIISASRTEHADLFRAALGGYGLVGAIYEATLKTCANSLLRREHLSLPSETPGVDLFAWMKAGQLAYGRLSVPGFKDYELTRYLPVAAQAPQEELQAEPFVPLKRSLFRLSEDSHLGKRIRWLSETLLEPLLSPSIISRNQLTFWDFRFIWNSRPDPKDELSEYFVPVQNAARFVAALRDLSSDLDVDLLNVTLRFVAKDQDSLLPYATQDVLSFVILSSVSTERRAATRRFQEALSSQVLALGGSVYLPYLPNFSLQQFQATYPGWASFLEVKRRYDPSNRFQNQFWQFLQPHG